MFYFTACTTGYAIPVQKDSIKAKATLDRLMWRPVGSNKGIQKGCQSGKADNLDTYWILLLILRVVCGSVVLCHGLLWYVFHQEKS